MTMPEMTATQEAHYQALVAIEDWIVSAAGLGVRRTVEGHDDPWGPMGAAIDQMLIRLSAEQSATIVGMIVQDLCRMTAITESMSKELAGLTGEDANAVCDRHEAAYLAALDPDDDDGDHLGGDYGYDDDDEQDKAG